MKVEITVEKIQRIAMEVEVTEEQLEQLKSGINPFHEDFEEEFSDETGDIEYDYAVNDLDGNEIVSWS